VCSSDLDLDLDPAEAVPLSDAALTPYHDATLATAAGAARVKGDLTVLGLGGGALERGEVEGRAVIVP
jgi:hypothetical protein